MLPTNGARCTRSGTCLAGCEHGWTGPYCNYTGTLAYRYRRWLKWGVAIEGWAPCFDFSPCWIPRSRSSSLLHTSSKSNKLWCGAQQTPPPAATYATDLLTPVFCCHLANATDSELWPVITNNLTFGPPTRLHELTQNWIRSSHGHSTPSLKISCKSVQPFSRNVADKETNKQRKKERKNSLDYNYTPSTYWGRGKLPRLGETCSYPVTVPSTKTDGITVISVWVEWRDLQIDRDVGRKLPQFPCTAAVP